jgi:hypothetical protein
MSTRTAKKQKCLTFGCNSPALARGLCQCCRKAAAAAIGRGETTERELIKKGLILEPKRSGRPPSSKFAQALRRSAS